MRCSDKKLASYISAKMRYPAASVLRGCCCGIAAGRARCLQLLALAAAASSTAQTNVAIAGAGGAGTICGGCSSTNATACGLFLDPNSTQRGSSQQPLIYQPMDACSADVFVAPALTVPEHAASPPPPLFLQARTWMYVPANETSPATQQDYLRIAQAFTSHADPCYTSNIGWSYFCESATAITTVSGATGQPGLGLCSPNSTTPAALATDFPQPPPLSSIANVTTHATSSIPAGMARIGLVFRPTPLQMSSFVNGTFSFNEDDTPTKTGVPAAQYAACMQRVLYRNLAARPCGPYPWQGWIPEELWSSTGNCSTPLQETASYRPGARTIYFELCGSDGCPSDETENHGSTQPQQQGEMIDVPRAPNGMPIANAVTAGSTTPAACSLSPHGWLLDARPVINGTPSNQTIDTADNCKTREG